MKKKLIAVLMIAVLTLSLAACQGKDDSKDTSKKEKTEDSSEKKAAPKKEQKKVEITLPSSLVGDSEATLDEEAKAAGVTEVTKNEDGSVTLKMTEEAHQNLLNEIKTGIDESIQEILQDKENYPSFDSITYNDEVTEFDVNVDASVYGGLESFVVIALYVEGNMYQSLNAVPEDQLKTIVNFKNKDTGEVIESGDSTAMDDSALSE